MKKKVNIVSEGHRADVGPYKVNRIIGNRYVDAVGSVVFLDHALPMQHLQDEPRRKANGEGAHPHRGIATITYMLNGEAVHLDSRGHFAIVGTGGVQWMKAGNGIIHDEVINVDGQANNLLTEGLQFWINLPAKNKAEAPAYLPVKANDVPKKILDNNGSWLKVILGEFEKQASPIPVYTKQFIWHIHLEPNSSFSFETTKEFEYGAFLPLTAAHINDVDYRKGEFLLFDQDNGTIDINSTEAGMDVIFIGGEPYKEPIVAQGPFVMNTQQEISKAYNDFYEGKYGEIDYSLAD